MHAAKRWWKLLFSTQISVRPPRLLRLCYALIHAPSRWLEHYFPTLYSGAVQRWNIILFLRRLRKQHPGDYHILTAADLPERLRRIIFARLATWKGWRSWPGISSRPSISSDVLFVSYRAHPDLVKQCIALKREYPALRCALVVEEHALTQRLCQRWFDEVMVFSRSDPAALLSVLRNADAKVIILRYRDVVFNICARLFRRGPLIYCPPGFFLSSRSEDYLSDPALTFDAVFEADKFVLERVEGVIHFLSDEAIQWFKANGVDVSAPTATVYVACMPELDPPIQLPKLSEKDGEWHIVHATGVARVTDDPKWCGDGYLSLAKCEVLVRQGIHIHVYAPYFDKNDPGYAPFIELAERSPYIHIEEQLEFDDLLTALTQYDYAWKHWDVSRMAIWPVFAQYLTANIHAYIQSGLPLMISPSAPPLEVRMVHKYGIGLCVAEEELQNLKQLLDDNRKNLAGMQQRVRRAKEEVFYYDAQSLLKVIGPYLAS